MTHTHTESRKTPQFKWKPATSISDKQQYNTIQYNTKFVKRHVAVASEALNNNNDRLTAFDPGQPG